MRNGKEYKLEEICVSIFIKIRLTALLTLIDPNTAVKPPIKCRIPLVKCRIMPIKCRILLIKCRIVLMMRCRIMRKNNKFIE